MAVNPDSVTLHIGELVLTGFPPGSRHAIGDAVQSELVRLIGENGIRGALAQGGSYEQLQGGDFTLTPRMRTRASGSGIAERLHATLLQGGDTNGTR